MRRTFGDELFSLTAPPPTCYPVRSSNERLSKTHPLPFAGQHETQKQKFYGTKLPIVVGCRQTTTDSMNLSFSTDRLVAPLAGRPGDSSPIRSRQRDCAMRNRSSENEGDCYASDIRDR